MHTPIRRPATLRELFTGFFSVGIVGFGGVMPWIRRMVVEQRGWLTPAEFTDMLAPFVVARLWHRAGASRWRGLIQAGLTPVTVGLVLAAALLLSLSTMRGAGSALVTLASAAVLLRTRLHPLWLLAAGAALGAVGLA